MSIIEIGLINSTAQTVESYERNVSAALNLNDVNDIKFAH